jgi:epoxyqueuosine reductase
MSATLQTRSANHSTPAAPDSEVIKAWALELGFADAAVARPGLEADLTQLNRWLDDGFHGSMAYMAQQPERRIRPAALHPGTLSVISLRMDYLPDAADAGRILADGERAYIARYALGRDYHKLLRSRLKKLGARIATEIAPHGFRVFTDSAPVLEKAIARNAGLGWIGKNTLLLNRNAGSWFLLGEIYTDLPLAPTGREEAVSHCGSCTACIDICPTQAIVGPQRLDARRCISYLTIENRDSIPVEFRTAIGNRIFGCDDCQLVCPWNRYARRSVEADFQPRHGLDAAGLAELFSWSEEEWLKRTEGMALRRAGWRGWLRNIAVALGNAPETSGIRSALAARADHDDAMVREHIEWARERQAAKNRPARQRMFESGADT